VRAFAMIFAEEIWESRGRCSAYVESTAGRAKRAGHFIALLSEVTGHEEFHCFPRSLIFFLFSPQM
jgi:hypothetical protein